MNLRLVLLRGLALLLVLPGVGVVLLGVGMGLGYGGWVWLLAAVMMVLGGLFISVPIRFLRRPTYAVSDELIGVFSFIAFGVAHSALRRAAPDAWGIPALLGIGSENGNMVQLLAALVVAWVVFRVLKKFFAGVIRAEIPAAKEP